MANRNVPRFSVVKQEDERWTRVCTVATIVPTLLKAQLCMYESVCSFAISLSLPGGRQILEMLIFSSLDDNYQH